MLTPLLNINVKSLVVFGALMAISAFIVPLFANNNPAMQEANANNPGEDLNKYYYDHHWASKQHKSRISLFFLIFYKYLFELKSL